MAAGLPLVATRLSTPLFCVRPTNSLHPVAPMRCAFSSADKESLKVIDSRTCENGRSIRRRRECLNCSKRFTTYERVEQVTRLMVVKRDGRRVPWDRGDGRG